MKKQGISTKYKSEFSTWSSMRYRCKNPGNAAWKNYGGRGISVCERWDASFTSFLEDMGPRPSPNHSLDRIDNDGNYEPGNCRWATQKEQMRNSCVADVITFNGQTKSVRDWAEETGIKWWTLKQRIKNGWPPEIALTAPRGHHVGKMRGKTWQDFRRDPNRAYRPSREISPPSPYIPSPPEKEK